MRKTLLVILFTLTSVTLSAQNKWIYRLGFSGEMRSGNVNTAIFKNDGRIERNDSIIALSANYGIGYGMKDKELYDLSFTSTLKADLWQYDRWSPFMLGTYLNNKFKGYEYKFSFLAGAKYRIYTVPKVCDYSISAAYVMDYTEYFAKDRNNDRFQPQVSRISLRFKIKQRISDVVSILHTTFYQPSLMNINGFKSVKEDYIVTSQTSFSNRIGRNVFLDINFNYEYRSLVPDKVKPHDITTSATLRINF